MFNYDNIGEKIKGLARWVFIVEAICGAISGLAILLRGSIFVLVGPLVAFIIATIAWVTSWLLYGFGELISLTADNNFTLRNISKGTQNNTTSFANPTSTSNNQSAANSVTYKNTSKQEKITIDSLMRCPSCGKIVLANSSFCEACGAPINNYK